MLALWRRSVELKGSVPDAPVGVEAVVEDALLAPTFGQGGAKAVIDGVTPREIDLAEGAQGVALLCRSYTCALASQQAAESDQVGSERAVEGDILAYRRPGR